MDTQNTKPGQDIESVESTSKEAIHAAKNAAQAIEVAREAQLAKTVSETVQRTKDALLEGLKEVFGDSDSSSPGQMKILVRRIPIICSEINQIHTDIADIKDNTKWIVRIVVGAVVLAMLKLVIL